MSNKLFVGNIEWSITEADLQNLFSQAGPVEEVKIIMDRDTGRSKGFGFITYADENSALKAIQEFDGFELNGRRLGVNEARPQEPRPQMAA